MSLFRIWALSQSIHVEFYNMSVISERTESSDSNKEEMAFLYRFNAFPYGGSRARKVDRFYVCYRLEKGVCTDSFGIHCAVLSGRRVLRAWGMHCSLVWHDLFVSGVSREITDRAKHVKDAICKQQPVERSNTISLKKKDEWFQVRESLLGATGSDFDVYIPCPCRILCLGFSHVTWMLLDYPWKPCWSSFCPHRATMKHDDASCSHPATWSWTECRHKNETHVECSLTSQETLKYKFVAGGWMMTWNLLKHHRRVAKANVIQ